MAKRNKTSWGTIAILGGLGILAYLILKEKQPSGASGSTLELPGTSTSTSSTVYMFGNPGLLNQGRNPYTGALTWKSIPLNSPLLTGNQPVYIQPGSGGIYGSKPSRGGIYAD